ncbi:MAG: 6-bladed beta-propeller [Bacteroidales bacterium]|jgi:hypothetical protein|nr:6-bladed beta-propeller [Bacteroidales bacterium]
MQKIKSLEIPGVRFLVFFIIMLAVSCTNKKTAQGTDEIAVLPYPHIIDMNEGFSNPAEIKLSEIADSIRYVVLSKDKQEVIGDIGKIQISENYIYLRSSSDGLVKRFDMTGNFLNSYGNSGRGPEEYLPGSVFTTTANDDKIIIFRSVMDSYLVFESDGNYVNTVDFPVSRTLFDFRSLSDSAFLCTFFFIGSIMKDNIPNPFVCSAGLFDFNGNPVKLIEHPLKNADISESDARNIVSMAPSITFFDNRIVLIPDGDTIYEINSKSVFPGYVINWGNIPHNQSNEDFFFRQSGPSNKAHIWSLILETYDRIFLRVTRGTEYYIFEYNKASGTVSSMPFERDKGFINDLDGGDSFFPYYTNRTGDIWIIEEDAFSFKGKNSPEFLDKSEAVYPEMKEKLKTFANNLKQDDNPVLKIVYLKKHNRQK